MRAGILSAMAVVVAACAADVPGSTVTQELVVPTGGPCPRFGCGANSPVVDTFEIHELSLRPGQQNLQGFEIETPNKVPALIQRGQIWQLHVQDGRIFGTQKAGAVRLEGQALIGATIPVKRGKQRYVLEINGVRDMQFFVPPYDRVEAYTLGWREITKDRSQNLCSAIKDLEDQAIADPEGLARETLGMAVFESIVFEGDRVDADAKTMAPKADDSWFNFGCAGHALAKLRLTHNTVHGQAAGLPRAWEQRQATLKMLAADYCGTGLPFTVAGQPLVWRGDQMVFWRPPRVLEARWNEQGAMCLVEPRLVHPTPAGARAFPDIWQAIQMFCQPQKCLDLDPYDDDGADRITGNP